MSDVRTELTSRPEHYIPIGEAGVAKSIFMKWSYRIARIAGIDVRIHLSFLLLPVIFGFLGWRDGGSGAAGESILFILLLFVCVVLHEFGHALAGRRFGIRTPDITLLPIGGVARMERIPEKPSQELAIALAGPAVNAVIAGSLAGILEATGGILIITPEAWRTLLQNLMTINLALVVFNLIPAFPMDGGRVLRAILGFALPFTTSSRIAARIGQVMALLFAIGGFLWNPMLLLIAFFVFNGARQEIEYIRQREAFEAFTSQMDSPEDRP
jgi:Zn-dependent protease